MPELNSGEVIIVVQGSGEQLETMRPHVRALSVLSPVKTILHTAIDWAIIFAATAVGMKYLNPLTWIACALVIASRQHALAIIMHDASHYRAFKDRKWNDRFSNWFLAFPLFITTEGYRKNHLAHHMKLNSDEDPDWIPRKGQPDWTFPKTAPQIYWMLLKVALGQGALQLLQFIIRYKADNETTAQKEKVNSYRIPYYIALIAAITYLHLWPAYLIYWIAPFLTFTALNLRIRSIAEHFGMEATHDLNSTRSSHCAFWERLLITPHLVHYHLEHHLYPSVPFYNLRKLNKLLMENEYYRTNAHTTRSYFGRGKGTLIHDITNAKKKEETTYDQRPQKRNS